MTNNTGRLVSLVFIAATFTASAQAPTYNLGRTANDAEVKQWMTTVGPEGKELRPGRGTAKEGAVIYTQNCIFCHGPEGENGRFNNLRGHPYFPFATTIWDYIYRAMPRALTNPGVQERQLSPDEAYALTAYLLFLNGIVGEDEVLDQNNLPKVHMPVVTKSEPTKY